MTASLDLDAYWMPFTSNRYFKSQPKLVASGRGAYLTFADGRRVFDCLSGLWSTPLGHSHPEIVAAVQAQVAELDYAPAFQVGHPEAFQLAAQIARWAPAGVNRVFFSNSGSEGVDTALKIAIAYHQARVLCPSIDEGAKAGRASLFTESRRGSGEVSAPVIRRERLCGSRGIWPDARIRIRARPR